MLHSDRDNNHDGAGQEIFSFYHLPAEIRNLIYHHHLTSEKIPPRHVALTKRWTPINLLYVSRTVYNEAFFHLYTNGEFVLAIRPESIFGLATCRGTSDIAADVGLETFVKSQKILNLIRHIDLEIHWPSVEYSQFMDCISDKTAPTMDSMLRHTIGAVGAMLSRLSGLRTVNISWFHMTVRASDPTEAAPPHYKIPGWLRGLKQIRRNNQNVLVRMPWKGPVSTEELAKEQEDRGEMSNLLRELREDIRELRGCLDEAFY